MNRQGKVLEFISHVMTAISSCALYGKEHPAVTQFSQKAVSVLDALYENDTFSIAFLSNSLVINEQLFAASSMHIVNFMKRMQRKRLDKIVVRRGITAEEMKEFISAMAEFDLLKQQYQHISYGIVGVKLAGDGQADVTAVMQENVGRFKESCRGISRFKKLDMVGLEEVVVSFISTLRQEANILKVISPVKSYSEYTYTHNTNVAVLSIFQAETLGLSADILHDIGMAGLLHDIGKMFVSKEVLEKQAKLDDNEWAEMQKHPVYGAMYLAKFDDIPKYAMIASYEHHMKFSGKGYPYFKRKSGRQHIVSQIIAISDFFDALRTDRPYRKPLDVPVIISLMKEAAGKDFNPQLVNNFICSLKRVCISA